MTTQKKRLIDVLFVTTLLVIVICASPHLAIANDEPEKAPSPTREFRAAWVASVANIDWPSKPGLSTAKQKSELLNLLDTAAKLNLNAVILQVRPSCDALYPSELEPWSEFLTGRMGKAPDPSYGPLAFAIEEAHVRGLELHAWFNPYRALHPSAKGPISKDHISKKKPQLVKKYGKQLWLDPGEPGAADHSIAVILDVVRRYDIDGVHLDDYFYPYPIKDDDKKHIPFPDDPSWERALANGEKLDRDDWRRQNVDRFVERLYREIKQEKRWVRFGVSPFGIWRPGNPSQIKGFDQYASIYADARKWFAEGWLDYFTPQLYWKIDPPAQSYPVLLSWWHEQNLQGRHLWPGNYTSKLFAEGEKKWPASEIIDQIEVTRTQPGASGNVHFSIKALTNNSGGIADKLIEGPYSQPALVPACPWLAEPDSSPLIKPILSLSQTNQESVVHLKSSNAGQPWLWVVRIRYDREWITKILPGDNSEFKIPTSYPLIEKTCAPEEVAVSMIDRIGQESPIESTSLRSP